MSKTNRELRSIHIGQSPVEWPQFACKWDRSRQNQRYALDPPDAAQFDEDYPNGFVLIEASLPALDALLGPGSRQGVEEFWAVGFSDKKLEIITDWQSGRALTPPYIFLFEVTNELVVGGGNHRLAVARAKGEKQIPILVRPEQAVRIQCVVTS